MSFNLSEEPVRVAVLGFIAAAIVLLVAFGVDLTATQIGALTGFAAAAYAVTEIFVRPKVTPLADPKVVVETRGADKLVVPLVPVTELEAQSVEPYVE